MFGGHPSHVWQLCFPLHLHAGGADFSFYDGSDLNTSIDQMVGPDALVLFIVECLSLLYLFFIS